MENDKCDKSEHTLAEAAGTDLQNGRETKRTMTTGKRKEHQNENDL